jgi:alkylation response protein AidB-like acyl-CoA dehydrogenase
VAGDLVVAAAIAQLRLDEAQTSLDAGRLSSADAAALKLTITDLFARAGQALRLLKRWLGSEDCDAFVDASLAARVYSGTSEVLRDQVAQSLRLGRPVRPLER